MKDVLRILSLVKDYKGRLIAYTILTVLSSVFGVVTITMAIPFLNIIFKQGETDVKVSDYEQAQGVFNLLGDFVKHIRDTEGPKAALLYVSVTLIVLFFLKNITRYFALNVLTPMRTGVIYTMREKIYQKINRLSMSFFTEQRKGDILTRMSSDVSEVEWTIMNSITSLIREPLTILVTLAFMLYISLELTLIIFLVLPLSGVIIGRIGKSLKKVSHIGQNTVDRLMSLAEETLTGARIVRAFNAEDFLAEKFHHINDEFRIQNKKMVNRRELSSPISEFLGSIVVAIVMYLGGILVVEAMGFNGNLTPDSFISYILSFALLISPAKAITTTFYNIKKGMASLERIEDLLNKEITITNKPNAIEKTVFTDKVVYNHITFRYGSHLDKVLHNVSIEIPKGKLVALVGQSGSGKSTLADLLPRFYDVEEGGVSIDGVDVRDIDLKSLRSMIGNVPQQSILFNETVLSNITFGADVVDRERAIEAAKNANAHEFITQLEHGYDTNLGEGGNKLSGGQKQRIAIARALYKNPQILILDEATSALDSESERAVQDALNKLMENRTSLVIAHRLSTVRHADEIVVMHKGEVVERGTHDKLFALGGIYARLCEMQSFA